MSEFEFNQKKFRDLLKKGIGTRTQKEFSAQAGIAQATISRMLNDETIPCPKVKTLETFAKYMNNVTLSELLDACGYEVPVLETVVMRFESDISDFFAFSDETVSVYSDMDDLLEKLKIFLGERVTRFFHFPSKEDIPGDFVKRGAENAEEVEFRWCYDNYRCTTYFRIFYVQTQKGKIFFIGTDIDTERYHGEKGFISNTCIRSPEDVINKSLLMQAIFGGRYDKHGNPCRCYITVRAGYGFEVAGTPDGFFDFMNVHADTFCCSKENILLYRRMISGEEPEDVFKEYRKGENVSGPLSAIADIMRLESGDEYQFFDKDHELPEDEQNACIMVCAKNNEIKKIDDHMLRYLHECAKLLKIPSLGVVYHRSAYFEDTEQVYQTDNLWFQEK